MARITSIITVASRTGGMLWKTETPGARMAAASCFSPEFLVAPETLISPSRGPPGRTRKYSRRRFAHGSAHGTTGSSEKLAMRDQAFL